MSDFLRLSDRSSDELADLVDLAADLAQRFAERRVPPLLAGRRIGCWWDGRGFRNRVAFELGAAELGATVIEIPGAVDGGEAVADRARYLDNWFDALVVRTPLLPRLETLADAADAPVINARTTHNHPCEILGDLAFAHGAGHPLGEPLHVVFVGEPTNLWRSWREAADVLPITVTLVCPEGFDRGLADEGREPHTVVRTLDHAPIEHADVVYTDCWPTAAAASDLPVGPEEIADRFGPLRITGAVLDRCPPGALFLPCPPVTRGQEVSDDAMTHPMCRVVEAKHWLLHAQNALLVRSLGLSTLP